jgi:glycosyltransferase involved in cell wall biosynthesis
MVGTALDTRGGVSSVERLILAHPPEGVEYRHLVTHRDGRLGKALPWLGAMGRLRGAARDADLAHVHFSAKGSLYRKAAIARRLRRLGVPLVLHAHGSGFDAFHAGLGARGKKAVAGFLAGADRVLVLSASWRDFYVGAGARPENVVVLPNPVRLPQRANDVGPAPAVRILFMGRLGERKGIYDLLEAAALVAREGRRFTLTVLGDGEVEQVRERATRLGLEGVLDLRAWVAEAERDALLAQAQVFALPSRAEGLPMALLEAMAHGMACVASPVGGIPELVREGHNGLLVPPGEPARLAAALRALLDDPGLRRRLGAAAREDVRPLAVDAYSARLGAVYADVLAERAGPADRGGPAERA